MLMYECVICHHLSPAILPTSCSSDSLMNLQLLTQVFSAPDVHHHVILSQLLKVFLVHDEQATRYHRSPAAAGRERQIKGKQDGLA